MQILKLVPNYNELSALIPELKALFWDMDGTLVNTEKLHAIAGIHTIQKEDAHFHMSAEKMQHMFYGETDSLVYHYFSKNSPHLKMSETEFLEAKNKYFLELLAKTHSDEYFHPAVRLLLEQCQTNQIKLALVTSSEKSITQKLLETLELTDFFDLILTREDTSKNKPDPMPYLTAKTNLNLDENNVIIFEDSPSGLKAAELSGMNFYKVTWYENYSDFKI